MYCDNCGKKLPEDAHQCTSCGGRVGMAPPSEVLPVPEPASFPKQMTRRKVYWLSLGIGVLLLGLGVYGSFISEGRKAATKVLGSAQRVDSPAPTVPPSTRPPSPGLPQTPQAVQSNPDSDVQVIENLFKSARDRNFQLWLSSLAGYDTDVNRIKQANPQVLWQRKITEREQTYLADFQKKLGADNPYVYSPAWEDHLIFFQDFKALKILGKKAVDPGQSLLALEGGTQVYVEVEYDNGRLFDYRRERRAIRKLIVAIALSRNTHKVSSNVNEMFSYATPPKVNVFAEIVDGSLEYF